jgi:elongation factor Ts
MVNASQVKELREKTGAGMMDCKKALLETKGDFDQAIDWLRKKGLSSAAKKADRVAVEGLTAVKTEGALGVVVEVNSETDFVAKNNIFQNLVKNIAIVALKCTDLNSLQTAIMPNGKSVTDEIIENIATIGENIKLRRMGVLKVTDGVIASYVHNSVSEGLGKISVLVALESKADKLKLAELGKKIAMHIAATNPQSLDITNLDQQLVQRERDIFAEQSKASGKPDNIIEKMVDGRVRKFYEEVVLLEQIFIMDNKTKISDVIANAAKELNSPIAITGFIRYGLGEGIELEEKNFANEVAAIINQ